MKKLILILLGLIFTTTTTFALIDHYRVIPAGVYKCQEGELTCIIHKSKKGELKFNKHCQEKLTDPQSKYASMIKRNQCKVLPDPNKYYVCEFADTKCQVTYSNKSSKVSCSKSKGKKKLTTTQYKEINTKVLELARQGQCRDLYPKTQSSAGR